jgi:hypothetical protein
VQEVVIARASERFLDFFNQQFRFRKIAVDPSIATMCPVKYSLNNLRFPFKQPAYVQVDVANDIEEKPD